MCKKGTQIDPKINAKFYLGMYKSFDKLTSVATSKFHPNYPYNTSTDTEKENLGYFLGYNFYNQIIFYNKK